MNKRQVRAGARAWRLCAKLRDPVTKQTNLRNKCKQFGGGLLASCAARVAQLVVFAEPVCAGASQDVQALGVTSEQASN